MRLAIEHRTEYRYSRAVFLEPLTLRLRPRCDITQSLHSYNIVMDPKPSGIGQCVDLDGNSSHTVWFDGLHERLHISVSATVQTHRHDPFDFLITDAAASILPVVYAQRLRPALNQYLERSQTDASVSAFAATIQTETDGGTVRFLTVLAERIRASFQYSVREQGDAWAPRETLERKFGACRDFAMLYVDACRCVGIAARFVSGYCYAEAASEYHLHAWAEAYLPGAGWRGFDPSEGLAVAERHVALATGRNAEDASPLFGLFRGDATPALTTLVSINKLPD
ncbi:MAG: transglutaminase family protein [Gammaproteobacteria bacterium]|nr:transglutaminase family protein [Gammaproteobacteria bacterium]